MDYEKSRYKNATSIANALGIGAASFASVWGQRDLGTGNGIWKRIF